MKKYKYIYLYLYLYISYQYISYIEDMANSRKYYRTPLFEDITAKIFPIWCKTPQIK